MVLPELVKRYSQKLLQGKLVFPSFLYRVLTL